MFSLSMHQIKDIEAKNYRDKMLVREAVIKHRKKEDEKERKKVQEYKTMFFAKQPDCVEMMPLKKPGNTK